MTSSKDPIWKNILKRFSGSLAAISGFFIGAIIFLAILAKIFDQTSEYDQHYLPMHVRINKDGSASTLSSNSSLILQIDIQGIIGGKNSLLTAKMVEKVLAQPALYKIDQKRIKGVFLNINSPGGSAAESDYIYELLMEYKKKHDIPIYAWIGSMGTSGGYYIACTADYIAAQRVNMIGSVGVVFGPHFNFYGLMQKYGVDQRTITAGKNKVGLPMFAPYPDGTSSYKDYIAISEAIYSRFLDIVVNAREKHGLTRDKLVDIGASVYDSIDAANLGYIDKAAVLQHEAIEDLAKGVNISEENYQVVSFTMKPPFMNSFRTKVEGVFSFFSQNTEPPFSLLMPNQGTL